MEILKKLQEKLGALTDREMIVMKETIVMARK